ncbi:MAG: hypothetical protein V4683_05100 [Bacteroidota bacterium]
MKINTIKKLLVLVLVLVLSTNYSFAQLGINSDNSEPSTNAMLDVKSSTKGILIPRVSSDLASPTEGLLYYNTTGHNFRYYDGSAWQNALFGNQWNVNGSKISYSGGNVGIGVLDPLYKLHVVGNFHTTGYITTDGWLGIGGYPNYKLNVFDGSLAITNTIDSKTWAFSYSSANNYLYLNEGSTPRMYFLNGGYVGIGVVPVYPLDVSGSIHSSNNLRADGNAYIDGTANIEGAAYVNGGKGVAYNVLDNNNIKIARFVTPQPATWGTPPAEYPIPAHGSHEITINLPAGYTSTPAVLVGSQYASGGDAGELYRAILVIYGCNNTQCTGKIINTDNSAMDYWVRWNLVAIGN